MESPGGTRPYRATGQTLLNLKDSMPTLNWIGKEAVVNHHLTVPFRLLKDVPELSLSFKSLQFFGGTSEGSAPFFICGD